MTSYFKGKSAIVTGAAQGIGFRICQELLSRGTKVILNDYNPLFLQQARDKLSEYTNLLTVEGDASDESIVNQMVSLATDKFGGLDFAIANAGLTVMGDFLQFPVEKLQRMLRLNLEGSFLLSQAAARLMIEKGTGGRIIFMSSVTGVQAHQDTEGYGMTKAALRMLAKDLGSKLARHGITVNCVAPGATLTERTISEEGYAESWSRVIPTGRASNTEDIANACLFFLGPQSSQVTGQTLVVDGGWTNISPLPPELYK
ncbi:MAG: 3-oxoacyl-ACP reductase [Cyclobacteriaceae bacterium]|nr:MAG: 3-oxoacyl-ACP reductase [Cyclobacteriaceae bacterium]